MAKSELKVYNLDGEQVGSLEHSFFDVQINDSLLTQVLRVYETNQHQGTKKAKTRGDLTGSDIKPWKQKGTGRARAGSRNSPIFTGGGVAHGPKPHTRRLSVSKKMRDLVMKYFIDSEIRDGRMYIVSSDIKETKTKSADQFARKFDIHHMKLVVILPQKEENLAKAFRNHRNIVIRRAEQISPRDMYGKMNYIMSEEAYKILVKRVTNG